MPCGQIITLFDPDSLVACRGGLCRFLAISEERNLGRRREVRAESESRENNNFDSGVGRVRRRALFGTAAKCASRNGRGSHGGTGTVRSCQNGELHGRHNYLNKLM